MANCWMTIYKPKMLHFQDEVDLRVPGVYCLKVALPEGIDDELATAKFNKTTKHLTVTMPID